MIGRSSVSLLDRINANGACLTWKTWWNDMLNIIRNRSIAGRLYILFAAFGIGLLTIGGMGLRTQWQEMRTARVQSLIALTEVARNVMDRQHTLVVQGKLSEAEAKAEAFAEIITMKFGHGDYIFVTNTAGVTVAHPNPALVGKDFSQLTDANGFNWTADVIPRAIRDGAASVYYLFPRVGGTALVEKVSVYAYYEPWRLFVGAGAYTDDMTRSFWSAASAMLGVAIVALLLIGGIALQVIRSTAYPLRKLSRTMEQLAQGEHPAAIPEAALSGEIGVMGKAVVVFKDAAIAKTKLEAEAQAAASAAAAERARVEAVRAEGAAQQATVVDGLASGLVRLSDGDLTFRLEQEFAADYEKLRHDYNAAMAQLQATMTTIAANTAGIRSGTGEIAQASDDLSRRTEQQAASLEQTAAALDEITATVRKTADGAKQAREVVSRTKVDAEHSGEVMRQAVTAMASIETSSQQISQIVGVIDEIAFQTNLLALNAGVEAARAGDAGRGFAVVASEVRALAQRSAEAAKEIKALISASTQQVGSGVKLVGETGHALTRIVAQVTEIDGVVGEIAASAHEQATGLAEVNTAINQMDQVTQQNAAMVEQSTAASHALAQETEDLVNLTNRFQLGLETSGKTHPANVELLRRPAPPARAPVLKIMGRDRGGSAVRKPRPAAHEEGWKEF
jgi:methyl-accepting chemotaxis protein